MLGGGCIRLICGLLIWRGAELAEACASMRDTTIAVTTNQATMQAPGAPGATTAAGGATTAAGGGATTVAGGGGGGGTTVAGGGGGGATTAAGGGATTVAGGGGATTVGGASTPAPTTTTTTATTTTTTGAPCTGFAVTFGPTLVDTADGDTQDIDCGANKALSGCPSCPTAAIVTLSCNAGTWMDGATPMVANPGLTCAPSCTALTVTNGDPIPELPNGETFTYSCPAGQAFLGCPNSCPVAVGGSVSLACSEPDWLDGGANMIGATLECAPPCVIQADTDVSPASMLHMFGSGIASVQACCELCKGDNGACVAYQFTAGGGSCTRFTNAEDPATLRTAVGTQYGVFNGCACV